MGILEKNMTAQQRLSRLGSTSIQSRLGIFWDSSPCQRLQRNRGLTGIRKRKTALRASKVNKPRSSPQQVKRSGSRSEGDMSDDEVEIRCLPGYPKIRVYDESDDRFYPARVVPKARCGPAAPGQITVMYAGSWQGWSENVTLERVHPTRGTAKRESSGASGVQQSSAQHGPRLVLQRDGHEEILEGAVGIPCIDFDAASRAWRANKQFDPEGQMWGYAQLAD